MKLAICTETVHTEVIQNKHSKRWMGGFFDIFYHKMNPTHVRFFAEFYGTILCKNGNIQVIFMNSRSGTKFIPVQWLCGGERHGGQQQWKQQP